MPNYSHFDDQRIKHLDLIQAVVSRLGGNGFLIKGWSLTVAGVFFGFAVERDEWPLLVASAFLTAVFWALDTYFLRAERLFRELYRRVALMDPSIEPFFMAATDPQFVASAPKNAKDFWRVAARPTLRNLYGAILLATIALGVALACWVN